MIVVNRVEDIHEALHGVCLTIGNFDGVHMGHAKLLQRTRERAVAAGLVSVALTFDPHPRRVLMGNAAPPAITMLEHKLECIGQSGVQVCVVLPFTRELAAREPEDFVGEVLVGGLCLKHLVIGYDYAFGKGRRGNFEMLSAMGQKYGFGVERLDPVIINGAVVSSTRIRDMVQAGNVWDARPLLGRFHQVRGLVVHGQKRGRKLGFPTANVGVRDELVPLSGVYAVWVEVDGILRPGVAPGGDGHHALAHEDRRVGHGPHDPAGAGNAAGRNPSRFRRTTAFDMNPKPTVCQKKSPLFAACCFAPPCR